jgi:hypothetical protein
MQYTDTITITNHLDSDKFTMLLMVFLISIIADCILNIICDRIRLKKIERIIFLIEKGHNRAVQERSRATSKGSEEIKVKEDGVNDECYRTARSYYTSV